MPNQATERGVLRVRERGPATDGELRRAIEGLLIISVETYRATGEIEVLDRRWLEDNVRFRR